LHYEYHFTVSCALSLQVKALRDRVDGFQDQYNEANRRQRIKLVLFQDALDHLTRIYRILTTPRGNALLVGVGGSGKQTLTRLAAFIAKSKVYQIQVTKNYTTTNLMDDLKAIYNLAGHDGKSVTFLFTDNEIKEEGFLEYINCILTSGEVPSLFPKEDVEGIISDLRPIMHKQRPKVRPTSPDHLFQHSDQKASLEACLPVLIGTRLSRPRGSVGGDPLSF